MSAHQEEWQSMIPDYLKGHLSEADRIRFEQALAEDSALAETLAWERKTWEAYQIHGPGGLQEKLEQIRRERTETDPGRIRILRWYSLSAAAAVALILLLIWLWPRNLNEARQWAYQAIPDYLSESLRQGSGAMPLSQEAQQLLQALEAYQASDYAQALPQLRAYLQQVPGDYEAQAYMGVCLVQSDSLAAAVPYWEAAYAQSRNPLKPETGLRLAALHQLLGQEARAREILTQLRKHADPNIREAATTLW